MTLDEIVSSFQTTPFLFIGSGITRRYYGLPNWEGLLKEFASRISDDPFIFASYINRAKEIDSSLGELPVVAGLIEKDFNYKWFSDCHFRHVFDEEILESIKENRCSPFKAEVAKFIRDHTKIDEKYIEEVTLLKTISKKSISGIITTNYDNFLESIVDNYTVYTGQEQLIFSAIQGVAEIYKIHGSCSLPETIVITESDYKDLKSKEAYLASKLMTIFMEYPIVFMGYSVSDNDIRDILQSIINCLSIDNLYKLKNRFIFVSYNIKCEQPLISPSSIVLDGKEVPMTKIELSNFSPFYMALSKKKAAMPVRMLRFFKQEFYNFVKSNTPTSNMIVRDLDDPNLEDSDCVLAIGKASTLGIKGLSGMTTNEWYSSFVFGCKEFSADELLLYAFPAIRKASQKLPIHKLISEAKNPPETCVIYAMEQNYNSIISPSIIKRRNSLSNDLHSVDAIWECDRYDISNKLALLACLTEDENDADKLELIIKKLFEDDANILQDKNTAKYGSGIATNLRRVIRLYDYLKYGKRESKQM